MPTRRSRPAVAVRLLWALLTRLISMLGPHHLYVLTSLSTTQTRALAASSSMRRRVRLDSRPVHRVRAISKPRPRMALSEFVARSVAVLYHDVVALCSWPPTRTLAQGRLPRIIAGLSRRDGSQ